MRVEVLPAAEVMAGSLAGPGLTGPLGGRIAVATPLSRELLELFASEEATVPVLVGWSADAESAGSPAAHARATLLQGIFRQTLFATPEARAVRPEHGARARAAVDLAFATASWLPTVADLIATQGIRRRFLVQAVECASMSAVCGAALDLDDDRLSGLALGGLVCDIGMLHMDQRLLAKPGRFTALERRQIQRHVEVGVRLLGPLRRVMPTVLQITEQHQERFDGSGYPAGVRGSAFCVEAQIVALARRYLAAIVPSHDRPALAPHLAMDIIFAEADRLASARVVEAFARSVAPLPRGEVVRLTDGRMGVVKNFGKDSPLRPRVEILWGADGEPIPPMIADLFYERTTFAMPAHSA